MQRAVIAQGGATILTSVLVSWALGCSNSDVGSNSSGGGGGAAHASGAGSPAAGGIAPATGGMTTAGTAGQLGTSATSGGLGAGGLAGGAGTGAATAGSTGTGGASQSGGCSKATTLMNGRASVMVEGMEREYILALPDDYDENKPYKLIFGWHPWGGSAQQVAGGGYYALTNEAKGEAIFVAPEGLEFGGSGLGWGNTDGQDLAFLAAMLDRFRSELCIDETRIFSTGFSFGGMMSFAAGCWSMGMMRAVAPMAGNIMVSGCEDGARPVALLGFHGTDDGVVEIAGGQAGRDVMAERNGCTTQTMPAEPSWCDGLAQNFQPCTCVAYQGCMPGYPVTWCEYTAGHMPAPSSGKTLWSFFSQF